MAKVEYLPYPVVKEWQAELTDLVERDVQLKEFPASKLRDMKAILDEVVGVREEMGEGSAKA